MQSSRDRPAEVLSMGSTNAEWVTLFAGNMSEVLALRAALDAEDIPTFVPDSMTKVIDPFITGGNVFEVRLQVPSCDYPRAAAALDELRDAKPAPSEDEDETAEPRSAMTDQELSALGRRVRWAAVMFLTAPVGFFWGLRYFEEARQRNPRPAHHGLTTAAFWLSVVDNIAIVVVLRMILKF